MRSKAPDYKFLMLEVAPPGAHADGGVSVRATEDFPSIDIIKPLLHMFIKVSCHVAAFVCSQMLLSTA